MDDQKYVHTFDKGYGDEIKFSVGSHKGNSYFDIRLYFQKEGSQFPTKKGLTLHVNYIGDFLAGVKRLEEAITTFAQTN